MRTLLAALAGFGSLLPYRGAPLVLRKASADTTRAVRDAAQVKRERKLQRNRKVLAK